MAVGVWGVWGMSKASCGLILRCARLRVGVPERTIYQTIIWYGQTMLWFGHKRGVPGQLGAGNTPVGSGSALEGRKWAKKARLGGFWPIRRVHACFEAKDARKNPKCGTSMDRRHQDLSVPVQMGALGHLGWQRGAAKEWVCPRGGVSARNRIIIITMIIINASVSPCLGRSEPASTVCGL